MAQIIKQPNGLYALFSRIVDDFILIDATPKDIVKELLDDRKREIEREVARVITILEEGGKPYFQFTRSFDEAIAWIKEIHGETTESLKMLGIKQGAPAEAKGGKGRKKR